MKTKTTRTLPVREVVINTNENITNLNENNELPKYIWKGLDFKKYSIISIIPQDSRNVVIVMRSTDPADLHWCVEYKGGGHYFDTLEELADYCKKRFKITISVIG